jgi:Flp pilus assembly pilin Flp
MYKFLTKNGQVLAFGLGVVIAVLFFLMIGSGVEQFDALPKEERGTTTIFNFGLYAALGLIVLCAILALLFGVFQTVMHPRASLKSLLGIVALIAVFLVAYFTANPNASASIAETLQEFQIGDGTSKFISGALWTALALAIIAAASFVISEIINFFK